jgi:hypothetical protein
MPCISGYTKEELDFIEKMKDPVFNKAQRKAWALDEKLTNAKYEKRLQLEKKELEHELKHHTLENLFFNSPMTVMLCKAMTLVITNFEFKYLNTDYEWWWNEHKYRDEHGVSIMDKEELAKKLIEFNNNYKVI